MLGWLNLYCQDYLNPNEVTMKDIGRIDHYLTTTKHEERRTARIIHEMYCPDNKVHEANMGPTWGPQDPGGPHVGPMSLDIRVYCKMWYNNGCYCNVMLLNKRETNIIERYFAFRYLIISALFSDFGFVYIRTVNIQQLNPFQWDSLHATFRHSVRDMA